MIDIRHEARRPQLAVSRPRDGAAAADHLRGSPAREIRQGHRAERRGGAPARGARAGGDRGAGEREQWEHAFYRAQENGFIAGGRINSAAGTELKATLINCFVQPVGDSISGRRGRRRHLRRAQRGGGDDAPRRRRGLRLLAHPAAGGARARHQQPRERSVVLHARVRSSLRDGRIGRLAPRRADGHPALRPSRHRGVHPRQGRRRRSPTSTSRSPSPMRSCAPCATTGRGTSCTGRRRHPTCSPPAHTSARTTCGCIARCARARCGTR